jgi:DNA (cytosine-5)-methyltransferase 1
VQLRERRLGFQHAWATDYDPDSCRTYAANIPGACEASVICKDIRDCDPSDFPAIDCLAFGFPCNDYSAVGEQLGLRGRFGPLYMHGIRFIDHHDPFVFLAENVGGLAKNESGRTLDRILLELTEAGSGYDVYPHLYRAEEYGVPQARHRILIVGLRKDLSLVFKPPVPVTRGNFRSVREALEDPPIPKWAANQEITRQARQVVERLSYIRPGENVFNATELPEHLRLNVAGATISQIYRRLDPDKPAYTITGSGGGGTHVYHWSENRALTNRERARLQTFPDDYVFHGSKESVRKQIGMAVPPLLAKHVFEAILKTLAGVDYPATDQNMESPSHGQARFIMERRIAYK